MVKKKRHEPDLHLHFIMDIDFWFILPKGHRYDGKEVLLADLVEESFILREEGGSTRKILFSLCNIHGVQPPSAGLHFHGINESIRAVISGYGIMLAPSLAVQEHLDRGEIGSVNGKGIEIKRPVNLCLRRRDAEIPNHIRNFLSLIKDRYFYFIVQPSGEFRG